MKSKSLRSQHCSINNVRSVCCSNNEQPLRVVYSIELSKKLVDNSFYDLVAISGSLWTHSINFIKKYKTGSILSGSLEQVSNTLLTLTKILVEKLWSFYIDKVCLASIGDSLGQHCLATAWRTI